MQKLVGLRDDTLVQDPSDSTKAALKVTVSSNLIAEDTPVAITVVTCTGQIRTLNLNLKKQSTVDTFTLMPLAYVIAANERQEIPFVAFDQNGVQVTKYADLVGVTLSNAYFSMKADGTAKVMVVPSFYNGPLTITALTSTGKISKLTLDIQQVARANSLTLDPSVLVSAMQSGAFQTIDCGYDYGGLTVKDQYGRVIDMVSNPGTYQVQAIVSSGSLTLSSTDGSANPAAYGQHGIRIGATMPGSGIVTFQLVDIANPNAAIDQKSVSFSVLTNSNIVGYRIDTVTDPIYATGTPGVASTARQIAYEANPYVYGLTASGSKVLLAGAPIIGASVDNTTDFTANGPLGPISTTSPVPYDRVYVSGYALANNATTSSAILTVTILGADGANHTLTTPLRSSMAAPIAQSLSLSVDPFVPAISISDDTVTVSNFYLLPAHGFVTGNYLTRYDENGARLRAPIYTKLRITY